MFLLWKNENNRLFFCFWKVSMTTMRWLCSNYLVLSSSTQSLGIRMEWAYAAIILVIFTSRTIDISRQYLNIKRRFSWQQWSSISQSKRLKRKRATNSKLRNRNQQISIRLSDRFQTDFAPKIKQKGILLRNEFYQIHRFQSSDNVFVSPLQKQYSINRANQ